MMKTTRKTRKDRLYFWFKTKVFKVPEGQMGSLLWQIVRCIICPSNISVALHHYWLGGYYDIMKDCFVLPGNRLVTWEAVLSAESLQQGLKARGYDMWEFEKVLTAQFTKEEAIWWFKTIQREGGIDHKVKELFPEQFKGELAVKLWNENTFSYGMEYGFLLALYHTNDLAVKDIQGAKIDSISL